MRGDLSERLLTHYVAGAWRAPLSVRMRDLPLQVGARPVRLVEAGAADAARAIDAAAAALGTDIPPAWQGAALDRLHSLADDIAALRHIETGLVEPLKLWMSPAPSGGGGAGPLVVLGSVAAPAGLVAGCILAGIAAGRPVLFKPAPRAAASGALIGEALACAGLPAGFFALLQGGGTATGAALLAAAGAWAGTMEPRALLAGKAAPRHAIVAEAAKAGVGLVGIAGE